MKKKGTLLLTIFFVVALGVSISVFTVDQTQQAIVIMLGKPMEGVFGPGLHFKIPFVQQSPMARLIPILIPKSSAHMIIFFFKPATPFIPVSYCSVQSSEWGKNGRGHTQIFPPSGIDSASF